MAAPTSPVTKGTPTIVWGTANQVGSPSGAIVESLKLSPKNAKPIEIEDNNGYAAVEVLLIDGFDATIEVMMDTAKTFPVEGSNMNLVLPWVTAGNLFGQSGANNTVTYTVLVCSLAPSTGRKKEGMVTIEATYRPGVAV